MTFPKMKLTTFLLGTIIFASMVYEMMEYKTLYLGLFLSSFGSYVFADFLEGKFGDD